MPLSASTYTNQTAGKTLYDLVFAGPAPGYLDKTHIFLYRDNVKQEDAGAPTGYSFNTDTNVTLDVATSEGEDIMFRRETPKEEPIVDFEMDAVLTDTDLDISTLQSLYVVHEVLDGFITLGAAGYIDANTKRIINLGDGILDQDAVTKIQLDAVTGAVAADAASAAASAATATEKADLAVSATAEVESDTAAAEAAKVAAEAAQVAAEAARDATLKGEMAWATQANMLNGQTVKLPLATPITPGKAVTTVTEQIEQIGVLDRLVPEEGKVSRQNFASAGATLTPSSVTGSITLTLSTGTWTANDVGRTIEGNAGKAVILTQDASATCTAIVITDFASTGAIAAGEWGAYDLAFTGEGIELSHYSTIGTWDTDTVPTTGPAVNLHAYNSGEDIDTVTLTDDVNLTVYKADDGALHVRTITAIGVSSLVSDATVIWPGVDVSLASLVKLTDTVALLFYKAGSPVGLEVVALTVVDGVISAGNREVISSSAPTSIDSVKVDDNLIALGYTSAGSAYVRLVTFTENGTIDAIGGVTTVDTGTHSRMRIAVISPGNLALATYRTDAAIRTHLVTWSGLACTFVSSVSAVGNAADNTPALATMEGGAILMVGYSNGGGSEIHVLEDVGTSLQNRGQTSVYIGVSKGLTLTRLPTTGLYLLTAGASTTRHLIPFTATEGAGFVIGTDRTTTTVSGGAQGEHCSILSDGRLLRAESDGNTSAIRIVAPPYTMTSAASQEGAVVTTDVGQIDTTFFVDPNALAMTDQPFAEIVSYAFSLDGRVTWQIVRSGESPRSIAKFDTVWKYNSDTTFANETWVAASEDNVYRALIEAIGVSQNLMSATQAAAVSDAEWPAFGPTFDRAITIKTAEPLSPPAAKTFDLNYDAGDIVKVKTSDYKVLHNLDGAAVQVTKLSSGTSKNSFIYVSA